MGGKAMTVTDAADFLHQQRSRLLNNIHENALNSASLTQPFCLIWILEKTENCCLDCLTLKAHFF
ncbi:hypothetical protein Lwal_2866 [Legionella waltersii]|uniref:Uncharacterized protein n=1 Tax=Legionella waltersii TaxID=66969 RepID=A0A0W1A0Q8_9GAMM|nr:hypothetical protein Lwal_2866 [Legionella waltersii]SNV11675.1 Uncharacterised protein [Legionella waltersii]